MDLSPVANLMRELASWRVTAAAAEQDLREAEDAAIVADVRLGKARDAQRQVIAKVQQIESQLAGLIIDVTAPAPDLFKAMG